MPESFNKQHSKLRGKLIMENKKEKSNARFTDESMDKALALVKQGISLREAAKLTNLAYATVRRYWLKKQQQQQLICSNGTINKNNQLRKIQPKQIKHDYNWNEMFTSEQEFQLAEMCKGATVQQCRKLIYQMAIENNVRMNPKWHNEQLAGRDWLANFQIRQRSILFDDPYSHLAAAGPPIIDKITKEDDKLNETYQHLPLKTELIEGNHNCAGGGRNDESETNIWNNNLYDTENNMDIVEKNQLIEVLDNNNQNDNSAGCSSRSKTIINDENLKKTDDVDDIDISKNFQNGLLNVLSHIANIAAKEKAKDSDELFLMSLLPSLRKVKEEDKLKAKIELIKVLDHF